MTDSQAALHDRLNGAKRIALTDEENFWLPKSPEYWIAKISERTGVAPSALRFYERMGARVMQEWKLCRLTGESLTRIAAGRS